MVKAHKVRKTTLQWGKEQKGEGKKQCGGEK